MKQTSRRAVAIIAGIVLMVIYTFVTIFSHSTYQAAAVDGTPTSTNTPTPTSVPGPPQLIEPGDGALLPQPIPPDEWFFTWSARTGPCYCTISISGPGGRYISDDVYWQETGYVYHYTADDYLPDDALTPWFWSVSVNCLGVYNYSEVRTFSVEPAPFRRVYVPVVVRNYAPD